MFENLLNALWRSYRLTKQGASQRDVKNPLREVRVALLEAELS